MMLVALPDKEDLRNRREADLAGFGWSRSHRRFGSEGWTESGTISLGFRIVVVSQEVHKVSQATHGE